MDEGKKVYKILSIDGGGIRGIFTSSTLDALEKHFNRRTADCFDMICGTSTGAIIAAALSIGLTAAEITAFFRDEGPKVFPYVTWPARCLAFLKQALFKSKYDNTSLRTSLVKVFGNRTLNDAKVDLCIPVFNMSKSSPYILRSDRSNRYSDNPSPLLVDVLLATSAAPGYFPIHSLNNNLYIDGGLWANNPSLVGLFEAMKLQGIAISYTQFNILSVGNIENAIAGRVSQKGLSFWQWYKTEWLLESYFQAQSKMINHYAETISSVLPLRYVRLASPCFTETNFKIEIDNASPGTLLELERLGVITGELESANPEVSLFFQ